uniref:Uncharacterized protein n=1 Tax=Romanomermis culicivorax TaxID=13658 RepID=A0A915IVV0_ROMCU
MEIRKLYSFFPAKLDIATRFTRKFLNFGFKRTKNRSFRREKFTALVKPSRSQQAAAPFSTTFSCPCGTLARWSLTARCFLAAVFNVLCLAVACESIDDDDDEPRSSLLTSFFT